MKAKIWCECTCAVCGGMASTSRFYKNKKSISKMKESIKDWVWSDELCGNICPDCQNKKD